MSSETPDTIIPSVSARGYSAQVRITLHANGQTYRVAQIGGGRLIFSSPVTFPQCSGTIVMIVDRHEERWHVEIPAQSEPSRVVSGEISPV